MTEAEKEDRIKGLKMGAYRMEGPLERRMELKRANNDFKDLVTGLQKFVADEPADITEVADLNKRYEEEIRIQNEEKLNKLGVNPNLTQLLDTPTPPTPVGGGDTHTPPVAGVGAADPNANPAEYGATMGLFPWTPKTPAETPIYHIMEGKTPNFKDFRREGAGVVPEALVFEGSRVLYQKN